MLGPIQKFLSSLVNLDSNPKRKSSKVSFSGGPGGDSPSGDTLSECPVVALTQHSLINRDGVFVRMAELPPLPLGAESILLGGYMQKFQSALDLLPPTFKMQVSILLDFHHPAADLAYFLAHSDQFKEMAQAPGTGPFHRKGKKALQQACEAMVAYLQRHFETSYPVFTRMVFTLYHDPLGGLRKGIVIGPNGTPIPAVMDGILAQSEEAEQALDKNMGYLLEAFGQSSLQLTPLSVGQMCQRVWTSLHPQAAGASSLDPYRITEEVVNGGRNLVRVPDEEEFSPGMSFETLAELLVPDTIQYSDTWFRVDDVFCSGYVVYDFTPNRSVRVDTLRNLSSGFAGSLFLEYAEPASAIKDLERKGTELDAESLIRQSMSRKMNYSAGNESNTIEDARAQLQISGRPPIDIRFFLICTAPTLELLSQRGQELENKLRVLGVRFFNARMAQRKLYQSLPPVGIMALSQRPRNMTAGALSTFFWPRGTSTREANGIYLGIDRDTRVPLYYDPFGYKGTRNPSFLLIGSPGSGKSVATRSYMASALISGARVFACDPEGEMRDFCEQYGGRYIELGRVGGETINAVDILPEEEDPLRFSAERLVFFTQTIARREIPPGDEFNALSNSMRIALLDKGWLEKTDDGHFAKAANFQYDPLKAPTLLDIYNILKAESNVEPAGESLASVLAQFAKPEGIYSSYFNHPTSFNVSNESLVVFGFQKLNVDDEGDFLRIYIWQAMNMIWNELIRGNQANPDRPTYVFIDEVWKMLKGKDPAKPSIGGAAIDNLGRRARKRRGSLWMATQQVGEFLLDPIGNNIFTNVEHLFLLSMNEQTVTRYRGELNLNEHYNRLLTQIKTGTGLFRLHENYRLVDIMVPEEWGTTHANLYREDRGSR